MSLETDIQLWHKQLSWCTGGMVMALTQHKLERGEAEKWIEKCRTVASEVEAVLKERLDGAQKIKPRGNSDTKGSGGDDNERASKLQAPKERSRSDSRSSGKALSKKAGA